MEEIRPEPLQHSEARMHGRIETVIIESVITAVALSAKLHGTDLDVSIYTICKPEKKGKTG